MKFLISAPRPAEAYTSRHVTIEAEAITQSTMLWCGRILSGLFVLFTLGASIAPKSLDIPAAERTLTDLGWRPGNAIDIGPIELACVIFYPIPRTNLLGATLMMAVLGGAITSQWRVDAPVFSHSLLGVHLGLVMWGGLRLRDPALRALFPIR